MIEFLFTRPGSRCEIKERLIEDIKDTKFRIFLAMAYFTDQDIYDAMHESTASTALFVLNEGDVQDSNRRRSRSFDLVKNYKVHTVTLGDDRYSKMHHKFIILDNIAYIGSYNFSYPASSQSWEFAIRIADPVQVKKIEEEFWSMWFIGGSNSFRANKCTECNIVVDDPLDHFTINVNYDSFRRSINPRDYITTVCTPRNDNCSVCKVNKARVIIEKDSDQLSYCIKCAGNEMNRVFIYGQMGWEANNIYYDELAIWSKDELGENLLGECGLCKEVKTLELVNEIIRGRKSLDNPFGIDIGGSLNICQDCYRLDFFSAYIMDK